MKTVSLKSRRTGSNSVKSYVQAIKEGQHILPSEDGWKVKKSNAVKATKIFDNQEKAIEYARKIAMKQQSELSIHGKNGRIRQKNSYGNDSFPPRG
jgi:hypothetical protein